MTKFHAGFLFNDHYPCRDLQFCPEIDAGGGRVHKCLLEHKSQLSTACAAQEDKLSQIQSADVRLNPGFKACSEEMAVYCKGTEPGRGRMFRCLQSNLGKVDFSSQCREQVRKCFQGFKKNMHEESNGNCLLCGLGFRMYARRPKDSWAFP